VAWRVACETQTLASLSQKERLLNGSSRAKKERFWNNFADPLTPLMSSDTIGPELPFTSTSGCCGAARRTGLLCILQHFCWLKRRCADIATVQRPEANGSNEGLTKSDSRP
jgi:hypothetical protein